MTSAAGPQRHRWRGDVIVVGAGPAGCAAATVLARSGASVALVGGERRSAWPGETLASGSTELVEQVFGPSIFDGHKRAFAIQAAWETHELHTTDALTRPHSEGWLLNRPAFDVQARAAAERAGTLVASGHAQVERSEGWRAVLPGAVLEAPLIIDATGRNALIAQRAGASSIQASRLLACVAALPDRGDGVQATSIESVPEGWWYTTPTPVGGRVAVLISDADLVPRGDSRLAWWLDSLQRTAHVKELLPSFEPGALTITVSQAGTGWLDRPYGPDWVAVGDAAAHFDPLSSQGLVTGILMGARAAQAIASDTLGDWHRDYRMLVDEHLALSEHFYGLVDRWPGTPFWERRRP